jgi:ketopantoate hydroxymethyltransferase
MRDSVAIAAVGAFSLVLEGVAESLAREIDDMLGLFTEFTPKFVKRYCRHDAAREYTE